MMKAMSLSLIAALALVAGCATHASEPSAAAAPVGTVRSAEELSAYLAATPGSPLNRLGPDARESFLNNLVFGERGLASFRYADLGALSPDEIKEVLTVFGLERTLPIVMKGASAAPNKDGAPRMRPLGDHDGYYCERPGTCAKDTLSICTSNC